MNLTESDIIKACAKGNYRKRISILFYNFHRVPYAIEVCKDNIMDDIMEETASNRKQDYGDLGVRVQNKGLHSDPTQRDGIARAEVSTMLETGKISDTVFEFVDDPDEMKSRVENFIRMKAEYAKVKHYLGRLNEKEKELVDIYLSRNADLEELAEENNVIKGSIYTRISRISKRMADQIESELYRKGGKK